MYDEILKELYDEIEMHTGNDYKKMADMLDIIIKIKTIKALDTSAELIAMSRRVSRN